MDNILRELIYRFMEWVTKHLGKAIWGILSIGLLLIFLGAMFTELQEWQILTGNKLGSVLNMFAEKSFEEFLNRLVIGTLNPIGIEILGAVFVAISFLLLRDSNKEKIDTLERRIENLQNGQVKLLEMLTKIEASLNYKTNTHKKVRVKK